MAQDTPRALIFDLGNVVIDYSFDETFKTWGRIFSRDPREIRRLFPFDRAFERLERGEVSAEDYRQHISSALGLSFTERTLNAGWNAIYLGLKPGMVDLLRFLEKRFRLVALTNTTNLHVPFWKQKFREELAVFERIFCSSEIGARKPEAGAYQIVLDYLEAAPEDTAFFDDNAAFIRGAEELGIRSFLVSSADEVRAGLKELFGPTLSLPVPPQPGFRHEAP